MDTISNIRFDDWEAKQMQDPGFQAAVEELESAYQACRAWEMLRQGILDLGKAMAEVLAPAFRQVVDTIRAFIVQLQRAQLYIDLARHWWIPERFAHWLSAKWPERWLPELRFK